MKHYRPGERARLDDVGGLNRTPDAAGSLGDVFDGRSLRWLAGGWVELDLEDARPEGTEREIPVFVNDVEGGVDGVVVVLRGALEDQSLVAPSAGQTSRGLSR